MTTQSRPRAGGRRADSPETAGNHSPGLTAAQSVARLLRRQRGAVRRLAIALNPHSVPLLLALVLRIIRPNRLAGNNTTNQQRDSDKNANKTTPARTFARSPNNHERSLSKPRATSRQRLAGARGGPTFWCPVVPWTAAVPLCVAGREL